ncbi:MAG: hypothetical protein QGI45_14035 [Myxococcota bacterium]|jgi:hypothetical protein|nr:hypothetical protein [Myxococcota bacterium]
MMAIRFIGLCLALCGLGCGGSDTMMHFRATLPFAQKLSNCSGVATGDIFSAALNISGGFPVCDLAVNATDFTVSGECPDIVTGQERFLFIYYSVAPAQVTSLEQNKAIAYDISYVDLTSDGLEPGQTEQIVDIGGSQSETYYSDADADVTEINCDLSTIPLFDQARCWVHDYGIGGIPNSGLETLDSDGDGIDNFDELCSGTLFDSDESE